MIGSLEDHKLPRHAHDHRSSKFGLLLPSASMMAACVQTSTVKSPFPQANLTCSSVLQHRRSLIHDTQFYYISFSRLFAQVPSISLSSRWGITGCMEQSAGCTHHVVRSKLASSAPSFWVNLQVIVITRFCAAWLTGTPESERNGKLLGLMHIIFQAHSCQIKDTCYLRALSVSPGALSAGPEAVG